MHNRNRLVGGFEEAIERGQSTVKKSTKNAISDTANATKNQITGGGGDSSISLPKTDQGTNEAVAAGQIQDDSGQMTDEERVKFLRDLYGSEQTRGDGKKEEKKTQDKSAKKGSGGVSRALGVSQKDPNEGLTPEDIAKLEAARRQLHGDYYQEFIEKTKSREPSAKEKIEQEEKEKKMEELQVSQKDDRKKQALNPAIVKQGTAEAAVGTVG